MKKIVSFCMCIGLWIQLMGINVYAQPYGPTKLLVLGDSISTGYGLEGYQGGDNYSTNNYGKQLADTFEIAPKDYRNAAIDGSKTSDLITLLNHPSKELNTALKSSDTIVISIGGNDVFLPALSAIKVALGLSQSATGTELQRALQAKPGAVGVVAISLFNSRDVFQKAALEFMRNFGVINQQIRSVNPTATIYFINVYNPYKGIEGFESLALITEQALKPINDVIQGSASTKGYKVVDVATAFEGKAEQLTRSPQFEIHPNLGGHTFICQLVEDEIMRNNLTLATSSAKGVTRGEAVMILGRLADIDCNQYKTCSFEDVAQASEYLPYIQWAKEVGIAQGIGANQFAPDRRVTPKEISVIMNHYVEARKIKCFQP